MNNTNFAYALVLIFAALSIGTIAIQCFLLYRRRIKAETNLSEAEQQIFQMGQAYMFQEGTLLALQHSVPMEWQPLRQKSYKHAASFAEENYCTIPGHVEQWAMSLIDGYQGNIKRKLPETTKQTRIMPKNRSMATQFFEVQDIDNLENAG